MKISWPLFLLGAALFGYGLYVGRKVERERMAEQAESIRQSFLRIAEAGRKISAAIAERKRADEAQVKQAKTDTVASEPLRFKPGDTDKALRDGRLATYKDFGGQDN